MLGLRAANCGQQAGNIWGKEMEDEGCLSRLVYIGSFWCCRPISGDKNVLFLL